MTTVLAWLWSLLPVCRTHQTWVLFGACAKCVRHRAVIHQLRDAVAARAKRNGEAGEAVRCVPRGDGAA